MAEEAQQTMTPHLTRPTWSRRARALVALMALALFASVLSGSAMASPGSGEVSLSLKPGSSLLKQGVKVTYSAKAGKTGATKRLARKGKAGATQAVAIAIDDIVLGPPAVLGSPGVLTFAKGGDEVSISDLEVRVGAKGTAVSGKLGGKSLTVFRAEGAPTTDTTSVKLSNAKLSLTGKAARELRDRFDNDRISAGRIGSAAVSAAVTPPAKPAEPAKKIDDGGLVDPYPYASQCPIPVGKPGTGPGHIGGFASSPLFDVDQEVSGTSIEWGFKQDFRNYVLPSGSLLAVEGATAHPAGANMSVVGSFFEFPMDGTYEAGGKPNGAGDKLVADGTGAMLFCMPSHGFDIVFKNPTVTLDGDNSRITADVGTNVNGQWYPFQRADIAELDLGAATRNITDGGHTIEWEDIPATLTADGSQAAALSAFYPAGTPLDPVTVKTTVDRPLTAECTIDEGTATPPTVNFIQEALPSLSAPVVTGNAGTINWGFRRATRNTTTITPGPGLSPGTFQLLGGANESYPGNMGGAGSPAVPPVGGNGKFFRFPISSYQYEAGGAGGADDRLIATSEATVGFCVPNAGALGVVISKPTLVIDGANSRLVANAYSYRGPSSGWAGGRVDLVDLNTSAVSAVTGTGTVSWGEVLPNEQPLNNGIPVAGAIQTTALEPGGLNAGNTATNWDQVAAQITLP